MAEFADPSGEPGDYLYPAGTLFADTGPDNATVYLPYSLSYIYDTPGGQPERSVPVARRDVLHSVLAYFSYQFIIIWPGVPDAAGLTVTSHPNPFNPCTTITFTLPSATGVSLRVYNARGERVRVLLDDAPFAAGSHPAVWAGDDDRGAHLASGIYFYELRAGDATRLGKLTLVR